MAHGDEAAAAGLAVFAPIQDLREGYENDNIRGDELARHMTDGTHPFSKITGTIAASQIATNAVTPTKLQKRYRCGYTPMLTAGGNPASHTFSTGLTGPQVVTATPVRKIPGDSPGGQLDGWVQIDEINYDTGQVTVSLYGSASTDLMPFRARVAWQAVMI